MSSNSSSSTSNSKGSRVSESTISSGLMNSITSMSGSSISNEMALGSANSTFTVIEAASIFTSVKPMISLLISKSRSESFTLILTNSSNEIPSSPFFSTFSLS